MRFNFDTESFQSGLVVSITIGGAFFGSIVSGILGDWSGRWKVMFFADIIFVVTHKRNFHSFLYICVFIFVLKVNFKFYLLLRAMKSSIFQMDSTKG